jgi:hypothetical protein
MRKEGGVTMPSKSEVSRLFSLLYFVGVVLLAGSFFLLVPESRRTHAAWLDLAVIFAVFSLNFSLSFFWRISGSSFHERIPALGVLGLCDLLYTVLALGVLFYAASAGWPYRLQLVAQMCLIFTFAVAAAIAARGTVQVAEVAQQERATRAGLEELKALLAGCEAAASTLPEASGRVLQNLLKLKEDARYLSPSTQASARDFEAQMIAQLEEIQYQLRNTATPLPLFDLEARLEQCAAVMALRKQVQSH